MSWSYLSYLERICTFASQNIGKRSKHLKDTYKNNNRMIRIRKKENELCWLTSVSCEIRIYNSQVYKSTYSYRTYS